MNPADSDRRWRWLPIVIAIVAFASGLQGGFVLDDHLAIVANPVVNGELAWTDAFSRTFWGRALDVAPPSYRPFASLSFRLDHAVYGANALGFHITSLVLYLLSAVMAFVVARRHFDARACAIAVAIWAAMPLHVENVASLVGRADTLAVLFGLTGLWLAQRATHAPDPTRAVRLGLASTLAFVVALGSKESAITWPIVAALLAAWPSTHHRLPSRRGLVIAGTWSMVAALYWWWRSTAMPNAFDDAYIDDDVLAGATWPTRLWLGLDVLGQYAQLVFAPVDLCTGRKYAMVARPEGLTVATIVGALLVVTIAVDTRAAWRRARPAWLAMFLAAYVVYANVVFSVPEAMADRFMLGPSLFLVLAAMSLVERWLARRAASIVVTAVLLCECAASAFYATRWHDNHTLLQHAVLACPDSAHNRFRHAHDLATRGEIDEAIWHFAVAARIRERFPNRTVLTTDVWETSLSASERVYRAHELLAPALPEAAWRTAFARLMIAQHRPALARRILATSRVPIQATGEIDELDDVDAIDADDAIDAIKSAH